MVDIVQIIFEASSDRNIDKQSNCFKLRQKIEDLENKLLETFNEQQKKQYLELINLIYCCQSNEEYDLVKFVIDFYRSLFK